MFQVSPFAETQTVHLVFLLKRNYQTGRLQFTKLWRIDSNYTTLYLAHTCLDSLPRRLRTSAHHSGVEIIENGKGGAKKKRGKIQVYFH